MINFWHGNDGRFAFSGDVQRYVNIVGRIDPSENVAQAEFRVDGGAWRGLTLGPDGHRLAAAGDFNIDLDCQALAEGVHQVEVRVTTRDGVTHDRACGVELRGTDPGPLPASVDLSHRGIEHVQVVDGLWRQEEAGLRIIEPYYDRALAWGDPSWSDYTVRACLTLSGCRHPVGGDGGRNVIHAAIAPRWRGHTPDGRQPFRQWYPLGATCELRLQPDSRALCFRIIADPQRIVESEHVMPWHPDQPLWLEAGVRSIPSGGAFYMARAWYNGNQPPANWHVICKKEQEPIKAGAPLFLAHYTQTTWHRLEASPIALPSP